MFVTRQRFGYLAKHFSQISFPPNVTEDCIKESGSNFLAPPHNAPEIVMKTSIFCMCRYKVASAKIGSIDL